MRFTALHWLTSVFTILLTSDSLPAKNLYCFIYFIESITNAFAIVYMETDDRYSYVIQP